MSVYLLCMVHNTYLNNYFDFHVCLSFRRRVPCSVFRPCVRKLPPIPAAVWQNVTNKSCLVCVKSEKYAPWVTLRPQWDRCRQGEAKVCILDIKTTWSEFQKASQTATEQGKVELHIFNFKTTYSSKSPIIPLSCEVKPSCVYTILKVHYLLRDDPKQLCALAHLGCTRAAGTS